MVKASTMSPTSAPPLKARVAVRIARSTRRATPLARDLAIRSAVQTLDLLLHRTDIHDRQCARVTRAGEHRQLADRHGHDVVEESGRRRTKIAAAAALDEGGVGELGHEV